MSIPYCLSCIQSAPLLYQLRDGRFQIMEHRELAPLMVGPNYVIVERGFAAYLKTLDIKHLQIIDAVLYDPHESTETREYRQLVIDCRFMPESIGDIDLSQEMFLLMGENSLFVSPALKLRLENSPFKFLRFSYGLRVGGAQYIDRLQEPEDLRRWGVDRSIIDRAEEKSKHRSLAHDVVRRLREAFSDVVLGDGIGLHQAQAIDDYEDAEAVVRSRESDEKEDWTRIAPDELNACYSSLSFFDAEGMRFHLPAFLIADLQDTFLHGMAFYLTDIGERRAEQFALLSPVQRAAIRDYLKYIAVDEDYEFERPNILRALEEYWT